MRLHEHYKPMGIGKLCEMNIQRNVLKIHSEIRQCQVEKPELPGTDDRNIICHDKVA